jgi:hypothetical protein
LDKFNERNFQRTQHDVIHTNAEYKLDGCNHEWLNVKLQWFAIDEVFTAYKYNVPHLHGLKRKE